MNIFRENISHVNHWCVEEEVVIEFWDMRQVDGDVLWHRIFVARIFKLETVFQKKKRCQKTKWGFKGQGCLFMSPLVFSFISKKNDQL